MTAPELIASYRIERLLGVGSFATVWLGYDPELGARVAIKVLAENWSHDLRVRERFLEEGRLLWRLDHERLVRVHHVGELPDGRPYLVMGWAEAGSLRDRLTGGPQPAPVALRLLRQIAAGVSVLHDNGIVHRDLTPGNVLFRPAGPDGSAERVLISDLGLAKSVAAASGLTARAGTPGYMAPEQDQPLATVDTRTDVYGLGRLGMTLMPDPPPRVVAVLRRATATRPGDRYPDARAFDQALAEAVSGGQSSRWRRAGVVGAALLALLAAATGDVPQRLPPPDPGTARDGTGRIQVALPSGWRGEGSGWAGRHGADGRLEPALIISPDPARWPTDRAVPGAFVGMSPSLAASRPEDFLAGRPHAECSPSPARTTSQAGIDWRIVDYTGCRTGKPAITEAAGRAPGGLGLLYVQVVAPPGNGSPFVDSLLAGVRVLR